MTHLQIGLQTEIENVGTLFLVGTSDTFEEGKLQTVVHFICRCPWETPLSRYFYSWSLYKQDEVLGSRVETIDPVNDESCRLVTFSRKIGNDSLGNPYFFLGATARKLLRELRKAEDAELSSQEMDDQLNWANDHHYSRNCPMPNFSQRPRH